MCFPSTLQPEASIVLRRMTLATSPALDQNRAEQQPKEKKERAGERTVQDGRDYSRTGQERRDQREQGGEAVDMDEVREGKTDK